MTVDELRARVLAAGRRVTLLDAIDEPTLALLLGIADRTMRDRRTRQGDCPRFRVNGRSVVYALADVADYLGSRTSPAMSGNEWQS